MVESSQESNGRELLYIQTSLKRMSHLNIGVIKLVYHLLYVTMVTLTIKY